MDNGGSCVVPLLNVRKDLQCVNSWDILPLKLSLQKLCKFINCNMCFYHITYRYVGSSDAAWMTNVSCTSDQACISKCIIKSPIPAQTCPPDQYVSIKCGKCKVNLQHTVYFGHTSAIGHGLSDERFTAGDKRTCEINATLEGAVRLHGSSSSSGILQIYHNGMWGTVCRMSNSFNAAEGHVACRQLGYSVVERFIGTNV